MLSLVHSIDADAQLSVNIKDTALLQAASFDVDADANAGIGFISIPVSASASALYCEPGFTVVMECCRYGSDFLQETYLYHFTRKDTRHNFSPYFYMFYLMSANVHETSSFTSHFGSVLVFLPQLVLLLVTSLLLHRDLTLCCFVQTFIFVSFNKVCTSQVSLFQNELLHED